MNVLEVLKYFIGNQHLQQLNFVLTFRNINDKICKEYFTKLFKWSNYRL